MKFATAPIRPLTAIGVGLAVGATTLLGVPAPAAADQPQGAYWHTRVVYTKPHPWRFGSRSHPYALLEQQVMERWTRPDGKSWVGFRDLGTLPKSAADRKAWQRDGSPAKWSESIDGKTVKLSAEPSKGSVAPVPNVSSFRLAGQSLTYDEVQRLPADPKVLKDWLTRAARVGRVPESSIGRWVTGTLPQILHDLPAPKAARAAAYQALLTTPGVRSEGVVKDPLGRSGTALLLEEPMNQKKSVASVKTRLIIDTGAMVLLSQHRTLSTDGRPTAGKDSHETMIEVGWTDSPPVVPALP
ncbi:hypothetical protein [Nonomuraea sp. NPDC050643]|uniref:hypothetical protein n=1 Tax=Nonomuraea sp. NPDC050643 TaxID=3155660 RepID=UPI00340CAB42